MASDDRVLMCAIKIGRPTEEAKWIYGLDEDLQPSSQGGIRIGQGRIEWLGFAHTDPDYAPPWLMTGAVLLKRVAAMLAMPQYLTV